MIIDCYLKIRHACSQTTFFEFIFVFSAAFILLFLPAEHAGGLAKRLRTNAPLLEWSMPASVKSLITMDPAFTSNSIDVVTGCSL
jgi:hypothetical protein